MSTGDFTHRDGCAGRAIVIPADGDIVFCVRDGVIRRGVVFYGDLDRETVALAVHMVEPGFNEWRAWSVTEGAWWVMEVFTTKEEAERVLASEQRKRAAGFLTNVPINGISRP